MTEAALGRSKNAEVSFSLDLANKPECLSLSVPQSWLVFHLNWTKSLLILS